MGSPTEKVEGIEELLIEILVQLPPKSVSRFSCVSKKWNEILRDPFFHESYNTKARNGRLCRGGTGRLSALIERTGFSVCYPNVTNIAPVAQLNDYKIKQVPSQFGLIAHSSNGLILCCDNYSPPYYVINPLTRMWVLLPSPPKPTLKSVAALVCDEYIHNTVLSFRVVRVYPKQYIDDNILIMQTYSSATGKWATSTLLAKEKISLEYVDPVISNGVFHWQMYQRYIVVYDSKRDEKHVQLIEIPPEYAYGELALTKCGDVLWWCQRHFDGSFNLWTLLGKENYGYDIASTIGRERWVLVHKVSIDCFLKDTKSLPRYIEFVGWVSGNGVTAIIKLDKLFYLYRLESKCPELEDVLSCCDTSTNPHYSLWHIYTEPLTLSSYALSSDYY